MKKILILAIFAFTGVNAMAEPPRVGDKCNANGENGRVQYNTYHYGDDNKKTDDYNYGGKAKVDTRYFDAEADGRKSSSNTRQSYGSGTVERTECVTDRGTYYNYNDGHIENKNR